MNNWILLVLSGLLEVVWSVSLKKSDGFSNISWSAVTLVVAILSLYMLSTAMRGLPLGTAYAVFTGIGAVGAFCFGIFAMGEPLGLVRVASAVLIVVGVAGLKLSSGT
jgi:quaternary ammonium compound-resistance protein SugE